MKEVIKFLLFLVYATSIFFLPNHAIIFSLLLVIHLFIMFFTKTKAKLAITNITHFLPFILLTFIINCILGYFSYAIWISIKLFLVCNITFIYSNSTTITRNCKNN